MLVLIERYVTPQRQKASGSANFYIKGDRHHEISVNCTHLEVKMKAFAALFLLGTFVVHVFASEMAFDRAVPDFFDDVQPEDGSVANDPSGLPHYVVNEEKCVCAAFRSLFYLCFFISYLIESKSSAISRFLKVRCFFIVYG